MMLEMSAIGLNHNFSKKYLKYLDMSREVYTFAVLKRYCGTSMPPHMVAFVVSARHIE